MQKQINEKLKFYTVNGRISCADCHKAAEELKVEPAFIGPVLDEMQIRINLCQLGLFGYKDTGKRLDPKAEASPEINKILQDRQSGGVIPCADCWEIADRFKLSRGLIGSVCEKLGLSIKPCQLGVF